MKFSFSRTVCKTVSIVKYPCTYVEKVTLWIRVVVTIRKISGQSRRNPKIVVASVAGNSWMR